MDKLKKIFPVSFLPYLTQNVMSLIVGILAYIGAGVVCAPVCALLVPVLGLGFIVAPLVGIYNTAGIVILILVYTKVIKFDAPAEAAEVEASVDAE